MAQEWDADAFVAADPITLIRSGQKFGSIGASKKELVFNLNFTLKSSANDQDAIQISYKRTHKISDAAARLVGASKMDSVANVAKGLFIKKFKEGIDYQAKEMSKILTRLDQKVKEKVKEFQDAYSPTTGLGATVQDHNKRQSQLENDLRRVSVQREKSWKDLTDTFTSELNKRIDALVKLCIKNSILHALPKKMKVKVGKDIDGYLKMAGIGIVVVVLVASIVLGAVTGVGAAFGAAGTIGFFALYVVDLVRKYRDLHKHRLAKYRTYLEDFKTELGNAEKALEKSHAALQVLDLHRNLIDRETNELRDNLARNEQKLAEETDEKKKKKAKADIEELKSELEKLEKIGDIGMRSEYIQELEKMIRTVQAYSKTNIPQEERYVGFIHEAMFNAFAIMGRIATTLGAPGTS